MSDGPALPAAENHRFYPSLNGLRAVAILCVFAGHYSLTVQWLPNLATLAVRTFFVLSGFLITGILYDTQDSPRRWRAFYGRRALRIFPLYYAALLCGAALWPVFHWVRDSSQWLWPFYMANYTRLIWPQRIASGVTDAFVSHSFGHHFNLFYGHFWTLCIEEQFYLVWPLLVFSVRGRARLMGICAAALVVDPLLRWWFQEHASAAVLGAGLLDRATWLQCDSLLLGALFALWLRGKHPSLTQIGRVLFCATLVCWLVLSVWAWRLPFGTAAMLMHHPDFPVLRSVAMNLFGGSLVLLAIDNSTLVARGLGVKPLTSLGVISYGFYVFHDIPHPAYVSVARALAHGHSHRVYGLTAAIGFGMTLLLAKLSFRYFETPFLRLKTRFEA